ncbi:glycosyltransferase family 2 protein [Flavobacterium sp. ACAM 123]|uniref:glycosyltransferase family 2 protein n=1 Tax=Flavobacterium sp. ACAM 123 TaxID=1189620 RepID=UPI0002DA02AF|nr:glycosyltransferase family 2 protein [Flavobacterium sp. ACAM 123]
MNLPLVSIIIPTYNRGLIISDTLNSVLAQTYTNWECIVVDDGSTDNTDVILAGFIEKDSRIQYCHRPDDRLKSASTCRNIGFEISKGSYIQYLDSDDLISENKLQEQVAILNSTSDYSIATCRWGRFSTIDGEIKMIENLESYQSFDSAEIFLTALANSMGYFPPHCYLIKRKLIEKSAGWNEYMSLNDDTEFLIRLFVNTENIYFSAEAIGYYRYGNNTNLSSHNQEQKVIDMINSFKMIDCLLKIRFKVKSVYYIEVIKDEIYDNVIKSFPHLICENKVFFINQLNFRLLKVMVKNRLKKYLKKWKIMF